MRAICHIYMYTLVFLIITTSRADGDFRENQNANLNNVRHVQQITGLVITRAVPYTIPQPYQVTVEQEVPYAVKVPVEVPVERPFEVHIPKPFTVPVIRPVPYPVHRIVPYPVQVPAKSSDERPTTPLPHISDYQQKPLDISNHIEYDVAASLARQVPVRPPQPSPSPPQPQPTPFPPMPSTSETTPFSFNFLDAMRFPLKPSDPMPAISYQSQRQFSGFNMAAPQFNEHQTFGANPTEQNQQQPSVLIRRPLTFGSDSAVLASFHQQQNSDHVPFSAIDSSNNSEEQNNDLLANFAEGAVFSLNNRLRRQSAARTTAPTSTTPKPKKS